MPSIATHRYLAFWLGAITVAAGVCSHLPAYFASASMHFRMAAMPTDGWMEAGMTLIVVGVALAAFGLSAPSAQTGAKSLLRLYSQPTAHLNRAHAKLVVVAAVALTVDVMKPASLAFVMPGMAREYGLSASTVGYLALSALIGTAVGSLAWGWASDRFGRRAAILLSAVLFMGTATCGTMPSFRWNLVMCFIMGAAAGGMLPIIFAVMTEIIPARHRGWLLVALGGVGTSAGYLAASGAAALLEPHFSWRILWLLNLPTGALIVLLGRYIPESPLVLARATGSAPAHPDGERRACVDTDAPAWSNGRRLWHGRYAGITGGLLLCGLAWGVVNFGFLMWLPTSLARVGIATSATGKLIAQSALVAMPGIALVACAYHYWSSFKSLLLCMGLTALGILAFAATGFLGTHGNTWVISATAIVLVAVSGVITAMLPYAAEVYPAPIRGTGTGLVAAGTKAGGILGAAVGIVGLFDSFAWSAAVVLLPLGVAFVLLWRGGVETRGQTLDSIQRMFASSKTL